MNILEVGVKKMWSLPKQRSKQKGRPKRSALILMVPEAESRKPYFNAATRLPSRDL